MVFTSTLSIFGTNDRVLIAHVIVLSGLPSILPLITGVGLLQFGV